MKAPWAGLCHLSAPAEKALGVGRREEKVFYVSSPALPRNPMALLTSCFRGAAPADWLPLGLPSTELWGGGGVELLSQLGWHCAEQSLLALNETFGNHQRWRNTSTSEGNVSCLFNCMIFQLQGRWGNDVIEGGCLPNGLTGVYMCLCVSVLSCASACCKYFICVIVCICVWSVCVYVRMCVY